MNQIQIKDIEIERLMLKIPTINEQKKFKNINK